MRPIFISRPIVFGIGVAVPLAVQRGQTPPPAVLTPAPAQAAAPKAVPHAGALPGPAASPERAAPPAGRPTAGAPNRVAQKPYLRDLERGRTRTAWLYAQHTERLRRTFLPSACADWNDDARAFAASRSAGRRLCCGRSSSA